MGNALLASEFIFLNWIPGYDQLDHTLSHALGWQDWFGGGPVESMVTVSLVILATLLITFLTLATRASWARDEDRVIPQDRMTIRNFIETMLDVCLQYGEMILGSREQARRFMPLIGGLTIYIFFSSIMGLLPFWAPSTSSLNATLGPALVVFFITHYVGVKAHGIRYFEEFLGPKIGGFPWLFPLFIPIEIISHVARVVSLSLRLMGNLLGDHMLLSVFLGFGVISILPIVVPLYFLGVIVACVQTLVFVLLAVVYVKLALAHDG